MFRWSHFFVEALTENILLESTHSHIDGSTGVVDVVDDLVVDLFEAKMFNITIKTENTHMSSDSRIGNSTFSRTNSRE